MADKVYSAIFSKVAKLLAKVWQYHLYVEDVSAKSPQESLALTPPISSRAVKYAIVKRSSDITRYQRNCRNTASHKSVQRAPSTAQIIGDNPSNTVRTTRQQSFARKMLSLFNHPTDIATPLPSYPDANNFQNETSLHPQRLQKRRHSSEVKLQSETKEQYKSIIPSSHSQPRVIYVFVKKPSSKIAAGSGGDQLMPPELPGPAQMRVAGPKSRVLQMRLLANAHFVSPSFFSSSLDAETAHEVISLQMYHSQQTPDDDDTWRPLYQHCSLRRTNAISQCVRTSGPSLDHQPESKNLDKSGSNGNGQDLNRANMQTILLEPKKPKHPFAKNAAYFKEGLLEWSSVVDVYRNFITQRYEEGLATIAALEVPTLHSESIA